jgi:hypothetical protein
MQMTTETLTSISIIAVLVTAVFVMAFRIFRLFHLLKEVKGRLALESVQKDQYKKKLAASPTRQEFLEQSELATGWRQNHDRLLTENKHMEAEIDRANEFITEAKSIMERQRLVIKENEWDFDELAHYANVIDKSKFLAPYLEASKAAIVQESIEDKTRL